MRELICPKCGGVYEQHPLDPANQELCPACRNKASWDEIRGELKSASKFKASSGAGLPPRASEPRARA